MIKPKDFYTLLSNSGINFFTGIPDSLLKDFCAYVTDNTVKERNIIAANEGGAIALAAGYNIATGNIPLVYMQNSGLGNSINPLLSLVAPEVYCIPMLLLIGWRGSPGVKDEPQHIKQGLLTLNLLTALQLPYDILPFDIEDSHKVIGKALKHFQEFNSPFALVVRPNTFDSYKLESTDNVIYEMTREEAIRHIVNLLGKDDIVISTTGMASRELFEYRKEKGSGNDNDFLTVGSMGHANQIALGIALNCPNKQVYCFDGDGAILMHTGSMGIIGNLAPRNFRHILLNNGAHDSVGGQPTIGYSTNFTQIAKAFNYTEVASVHDRVSLVTNFEKLGSFPGPTFLEISVKRGARKDLGRPTSSPIENKVALMVNLLR